MQNNNWKLHSDGKYHVIRANENTIIVSDIDDFHTTKKVLRSREMYNLLEKLLISKLKGEPIDTLLSEIEALKKEIDNYKIQ